MRVGLYPGTFDPVTHGHTDIIRRAARLVDRLVIGVAINRDTGPPFPPRERGGRLPPVARPPAPPPPPPRAPPVWPPASSSGSRSTATRVRSSPSRSAWPCSKPRSIP